MLLDFFQEFYSLLPHLFSGPEKQLLQAELPQTGFALVRKGFVLTPLAKPGAPPEVPAQPPRQ